MRRLFKLTAIMLFAASAFACNKDKDIDFGNIENLYEQPLPVIQKAVQGKWKLYRTCGGDAGCIYPENTFTEFTSNEIITDNEAESHEVRICSWKKKNIQIEGKEHPTYILWTDGADEASQAGIVFTGITNDTLYARSYSLTSDYTVFGFSYVLPIQQK